MPPKVKKEVKKPAPVVEEEPKEAPVYVHFKIESIENVTSFAKLSHEFSLELLHAGKPITSTNENGGIFCLKSHQHGDYLNDHDIVDVNLHYMLVVQPDSVEDVVLLADCPMLIVLNAIFDEMKPVEDVDIDANEDQSQSTQNSETHTSDEEVEETGTRLIKKEPIGYGSLDLIHIITTKSLDNYYEISVYPETTYPNIKTPKVNLQLYSAIGILQNVPLRFSNILTLTLENIFNPIECMCDPDYPVRVDFSFVGEEPQRTLFSFSPGNIEGFRRGKINKRWNGLPNVKGLETMTTYPNDNSLTGIYVDEADIFFNIDVDTDVCNFDSMHRILLTEEDSLNLENFILYKPEQICVTITVGDEEFPRFYGQVDLSPLVYPGVHQGRFVVEFRVFVVSQKPSLAPAAVIKNHQHTVKIKEKDFILPGDHIPVNIKSSTRPVMSPRISKSPSIKRAKRSSITSITTEIVNDGAGRLFAVFAIDLLKPLTVRSYEEDRDCAKMFAVKCKAEKMPQINEEKLQSITRAELADELITTIKNLPNCSEYFLSNTGDGMKIKCKEFQNTECYRDLRDNLMDKITKYTAANYHTKMPIHETNSEFKNLMTSVYNDLVNQIDEVVNDYYAGSRNFVDFAKIMALQNIRMFTAYETYDIGLFLYIAEAIWDDIEVETEDDETVFVDLVVKELMVDNRGGMEKKLAKLFDINEYNYYGLLIKLYLTYIENRSNTEVWLKPLLVITKKHPDEFEVWALLHVIYLSFSYRPGHIHAKMMCEKNYPPKKYPHFWERKHNYYDVVDYGNPFCCAVLIYLKLGLWIFAGLIFEKFKDIFDEYNRNRIQCYMLYKMNKITELKNFLNSMSSTDIENKFLVAIYKANLKYQSGKEYEAIIDYEIIYHEPEYQNLFFLCPYLRCGFWALKHKNFIDARSYFWTCCKNSHTSFLAWYGLGIALYRLKQYDGSELSFSKASSIFGKTSELWLYFAMLNVAKKDYRRAKECCQISRRFTLYEPELEEEMEHIFREKNIPIPPRI